MRGSVLWLVGVPMPVGAVERVQGASTQGVVTFAKPNAPARAAAK